MLLIIMYVTFKVDVTHLLKWMLPLPEPVNLVFAIQVGHWKIIALFKGAFSPSNTS